MLRLVLLIACASLAGCTSVFLYPDHKAYFAGRPLGTPAEDVWIGAPDGSRLHALYLPAQTAPRAAVLFLHGNAENVSSHVYAVSWLPAQGYGVLALDYRGYGRSQGEADIDAVHQDAQAALDWLADRAPSPLVVYGQSLGGSVALRLAAQTPKRDRIAAVVAESAFSGYRRIAREKLAQAWLTWPLQWPLSFLVSDRWSAIDVVDRISPIPLLLIHGQRDTIVDASHSQRLFDAAHEPRTLWLNPEGRHIDAMRGEAGRTRLLEFLGTALEKHDAAHIRPTTPP